MFCMATKDISQRENLALNPVKCLGSRYSLAKVLESGLSLSSLDRKEVPKGLNSPMDNARDLRCTTHTHRLLADRQQHEWARRPSASWMEHPLPRINLEGFQSNVDVYRMSIHDISETRHDSSCNKKTAKVVLIQPTAPQSAFRIICFGQTQTTATNPFRISILHHYPLTCKSAWNVSATTRSSGASCKAPVYCLVVHCTWCCCTKKRAKDRQTESERKEPGIWAATTTTTATTCSYHHPTLGVRLYQMNHPQQLHLLITVMVDTFHYLERVGEERSWLFTVSSLFRFIVVWFFWDCVLRRSFCRIIRGGWYCFYVEVQKLQPLNRAQTPREESSFVAHPPSVRPEERQTDRSSRYLSRSHFSWTWNAKTSFASMINTP